MSDLIKFDFDTFCLLRPLNLFTFKTFFCQPDKIKYRFSTRSRANLSSEFTASGCLLENPSQNFKKMSYRRVYDNWERLVEATLNREKLRQIGLSHSRETSFSSSFSFSVDLGSSRSNFRINSLFLHEPGHLKLRNMAKPILLAGQLIRATEEVTSFGQECLDLQFQARKLGALLGKAQLASHDLYDRPTRRIIDDTTQVLYDALTLVLKCRGVKRVLANLPAVAVAFSDMSSQVENSIRNVSWLLREDEHTPDAPPIASDEPILCHMWELIATVCTGSVEARCSAAVSLVSWANEDDVYRHLIIEEGGVRPLLRFLKEGKLELESAANLPGKNRLIDAFDMIESGLRSMFGILLKEGPIEVQGAVVSFLPELTAQFGISTNDFEAQDSFMLLVSKLEFETYAGGNLAPSNGHDGFKLGAENDGHSHELSTEKEGLIAQTSMMEMAGRALWNLARGNSAICQSMEGPGELLGFAVLLKKGPKAVQYYSAMTLLKVATTAERDRDFRRSVFRSNSPARKAVVDQLFRVVLERENPELLIPCIKAIGSLAKTFRATETRMIVSPLLELLEEQEANVSREACVALFKFTCVDNYACPNHTKAMIGAGGAKHLVRLLYFGEQTLQIRALVLLCNMALRVPESLELAEAEVDAALGWASEKWLLVRDEDVKKLLPKTKYALEWHRCRRCRGNAL